MRIIATRVIRFEPQQEPPKPHDRKGYMAQYREKHREKIRRQGVEWRRNRKAA